ncbi:hypothetical protein CDD82_5359 [Ophiocordyceps australis]|uniref:Uncharacterized protein n=1 Tax=Ophiocordyceps australis TaxID=1399860 RepID=A0A2C5ZS36_9HYPO|nr:hypothetical protein CDD82_5359 [Ophiocordyceps australis]
MDIHRCRFVPYQPSAVNALAFSNPKPKSLKQVADPRLALGRANGDIEIWNPANGAWHQEMVIRGGKDRSIDGLVWLNSEGQGNDKPRLFSIGYTSTVTEWDLERAKPKRHASGQHGDIWCIAAQPRAPDDKFANQSSPAPVLLAGTIDGELAQYSVEDDNLYFQRTLFRSSKKKTRMVSIAYQSHRIVIVGCSDSTIRAFDTYRGQPTRKMTLGSDLAGGSKDIIVWAIKCLPGGNIVSGDSTGHICIWDGETYTQTQRIEGHKQDVLSLAISADGACIMSGGMDRRTNLYKQNTGTHRRWSKVTGRRYHDHDVKSMASFEFGRISIVVSGGPDANLVVLPFRELGREYHRTISNLPQQPPIAGACNARFIISWWERQVHIWVLRKPVTELLDASSEGVNLDKNRKLLKTIVIKGDSNITSATIDMDGTLLIVSTATDVKAFRLEHKAPVKSSDVQVRSIQLPQRLTHLGATQVKLSPDARWLCLIQEGSRVLVTGLGRDQEPGDSETMILTTQKMSRIRRDILPHQRLSGLISYTRTITQAVFSADSKMLAVADLAGYIDTWIMRGHEATLRSVNSVDRADEASSSSDNASSSDENEDVDGGRQWIRTRNVKSIPKLSSSPCVLSFTNTIAESLDQVEKRQLENYEAMVASDYVLVAITMTWDFIAVHPRNGSLTAWSRRNRRQALPEQIAALTLPKGVIWKDSRAWVYGINYLVMLDMGQDLPRPKSDTDPTAGTPGTKRKRQETDSGAGGKMAKENFQPHRIRKHQVNGKFEDIDVGGGPRSLDDASDEDAANTGGELSRLRNSGGGKTEDNDQGSSDEPGKRKKWWMTLKYRPILGVVPLDATSEEKLEVALVERPMWDVDMPERLVTDDDRWR